MMSMFKISKSANYTVILLLLVFLFGLLGGTLFSFMKNSAPASEPELQETMLINPDNPIRIGYFLGGRVNIIYRTSIYNYFDDEGVNVNLYTKFLREEEIFEVPKSEEERVKMSKGKRNFGKMSGIEIVDGMVAGIFDGGTIGESSFIASINKGIPLVAVALLGYDAVPGKFILIRSDVEINSSEDLKGKTLISRRAGPGDAIFFREFLKDEGIGEDDVTIIDQVGEDDSETLLKEKKIDGGLYHLALGRRLVKAGEGYVYRPMDWMNSALSHALLVFDKNYLETHREEVQRFVNAYVNRIAYEKSIPEEEKDRSWSKGLMMVGEFQGMRIPIYDLPPRLRPELLEEMQDLLLEYGEIDAKVDIEDFIDYGFVETAMETL